MSLNTHSTTIIHPVRKALNITEAEYCLIDTVMKLANNRESKIPGWCYASKQELADDRAVTRQGVIKMINRLEGLGLLERSPKGHLRHTQKWYDAAVLNRENIVIDSDVNKVDGVNNVYRQRKQSLQEDVNKVYRQRKQSLQSKEQENKQENLTREETREKSRSEFQSDFFPFAATPETNTPPSPAAPPRADFENQAAFTVATYEQAETPTGPVLVEMHGEATRVPLAAQALKAKSKRAAPEITPEQIAAHLKPSEQGFFAQVIANGAWKDWTDYRMERDRFAYKSEKSAACAVRIMMAACAGNADQAQTVVDNSRGNNWQGMVPLKNNNSNARQQYQSGNNNTSDFYGGPAGSFTGGIRRD